MITCEYEATMSGLKGKKEVVVIVQAVRRTVDILRD